MKHYKDLRGKKIWGLTGINSVLKKNVNIGTGSVSVYAGKRNGFMQTLF